MRRRALRGAGAGGVVKLGSATGEVCCVRAGDAPMSGNAETAAIEIKSFSFIAIQFTLFCGSDYITIMADLNSDPLAWRPLKAPSLAELEVLAGEVFRHLPKRFRDLAADVVIQVDDFPSEDVLDEMQAESEFDLLGLFHGVGLPFRSESAAVQMPNMIWLYRRPILDYWAEHEETLGAIVKHVLVHEVGHHFGLSDADMAAIEQAAG